VAQRLPRAGPQQWERWAFSSRSGPFYRNQCGTGNAKGSDNALKRMRALSLVCCHADCSALVGYKAARRQAKQAGRVRFAPGDGCAGPECSADFRSARFAKRQCTQHLAASHVVVANNSKVPPPTYTAPSTWPLPTLSSQGAIT